MHVRGFEMSVWGFGAFGALETFFLGTDFLDLANGGLGGLGPLETSFWGIGAFAERDAED